MTQPDSLARAEVDAELEADTGAAPATGSPAASVRLGRKRDHTRDPEILAAAIDVLAETGFEGMTIDMVAARAKAGKATLYRRWPSKADLVLDAVACMKAGTVPAVVPDTGTLRGDLIALIKPHSIEEGAKKLHAAMTQPDSLARAEVDAIAMLMPAIAAFRTVVQRKPMDREFLVSLIDGVVLPAAGIGPRHSAQ
jgi:AcrR family transcriptional regulator